MLLRSDDINCDNKNLRKFLKITKDVPVLLAAEPRWLTKPETKSAVELVKQYKNATILIEQKTAKRNLNFRQVEVLKIIYLIL